MAKDDIFTPNFQQKSKTLKLLFEKGVTDEKSLLSLSTMQILQIATNYQEAFIISELQVNSKANKLYSYLGGNTNEQQSEVSHFVLNSISFVDGKRCRDTSWFKFRHIADEICREHGLYYNPNPRRKVITEYHQTQLEKAGMPTRYSLLREAIDTAIEHSGSLKEFEKNLQKLGYQYQLSESRKYWTVTPVGRKKPIRLINLGENYSNAAIRQRLLENSSRLDLKPFHPQTVVIRQYHLPTREDRIKKRGGLYGMYLYYCYRLGYLPKYKIKQNTARLHYVFREDLMKLDKLTAETTLLGRENIQSVEQLVIYKGSVEKSNL